MLSYREGIKMTTNQNSSNKEFYEKLASSFSARDRFIAAKSINTPREALNKLAKDAAQNVSFAAILNPISTNKRTSHEKEIVRCVICENFAKEETESKECITCIKPLVKNPLYSEHFI